MRKVNIVIGILSCFLAVSAFSQNSLLWKIEGDEIKTSYLFGTIHVMPVSKFEIKDKVEKTFQESEKLIMELDMSKPGMQLELMQYAMMNDGSKLSEMLSPEAFHVIDSMMISSSGMSLMVMNNMKPFIISSFLLNSVIGTEMGSYEMSLTEMALKDSIPIIGLESVAEQMAAFDSIPISDQIEGLETFVSDLKEQSEIYDAMVDMYVDEDTDGLYRMISEEMDSETEGEFLLERRNINWIPILINEMKSSSAFIAVGAGHLGGESGLIELLRKQGLTVSPVLKP